MSTGHKNVKAEKISVDVGVGPTNADVRQQMSTP